MLMVNHLVGFGAKAGSSLPYDSLYSLKFLATRPTNNVDTGISPSVGTGDFALAAYVKFDSVSFSTNGTIASNYGNVTSNVFIISEKAGEIRFWLDGSDVRVGSLSSGQWYHILAQRRNGTCEVFIDATQTGSTFSSGSSIATSENILLGSRPNNSAQLDGYINDFLYWEKRSFTASEVNKIRKRELADYQTSLVIHYKMNSGSGTTVINDAGSANGTISDSNAINWSSDTPTLPS